MTADTYTWARSIQLEAADRSARLAREPSTYAVRRELDALRAVAERLAAAVEEHEAQRCVVSLAERRRVR